MRFWNLGNGGEKHPNSRLNVTVLTTNNMHQMATEFPQAEVLATDIAPIQPSQIKPRNLTFGVDDITQPLPYETGTFDFVRMRFLILGLKVDQWQGVVDEIARVLKPGGYLELCEGDLTEYSDCEAYSEFLHISEFAISILNKELHT